MRERSESTILLFTLTELLAVVLIVLLLCMLGLSVAARVQADSLKISCAQNLKQVGVILSMYQMDFRYYPASTPSSFGDYTGWSDIYASTDLWGTSFLPLTGDMTYDPRIPRFLAKLNESAGLDGLCCPDIGLTGGWKDLGPYYYNCTHPWEFDLLS